MSDIERPSSFYLGKRLDPRAGALGEPLFYPARDLTTHAVCLGMTGSGKTGLCIDLLEEAALDGVPAIVIDPKGDITNMLLTFPELRPADFLPWINPDDAERAGLSPEAYAEQVARQWREGLAAWDQEPARVRRLKDAAEFVIYTPGSEAGAPVSILQTLAAPALSWDDQEELLREKVAGVVNALLALANVKSETVQTRGQVLLAHLFERAWRAGEDLDLAQLIGQIQKPPLRKLGVFDLDAYFPAAERMELALALNDIIAAPAFENWIAGTPLDMAQITRTADGRPRVAIFYIAHLSETERSFFITLLLEQVLAWMRGLSGTTSLRALLYFDEVFGYFPPHPADPPTKKPLLTLLKQARAFGLGVLLVTQNPVDLDYKGLTNAGAWFIGKLQTERDKARVLEGLEGAAVAEGANFDRAHFDRLIGSLKSRTFILHNIHADAPALFASRWAMSYLRGPLTRAQIRQLMHPPAATPAATSALAPAERPAPAPTAAWDATPPALPDSLGQYYLPIAEPDEAIVRQARGQIGLVYLPAIFGLATVRYAHTPSGVDLRQQLAYLLWPAQIGAVPDWAQAEQLALEKGDLLAQAHRAGRFADAPEALSTPSRLKALEKAFMTFVARDRTLVITHNPSLKLYARLDENQDDFRARCAQIVAERRQVELERIQGRYAERIRRLQERLRREELELTEDEIELDGRKREEVASAGESLVGFFTGRRAMRPFSTASRKRRLTSQAREEIAESETMIAQLREQLTQFQSAQESELAGARQRWARAEADIQELRVAPRRSDISLDAFGLAWAPMWEAELPDPHGERSRQLRPAYGAH